MKHSLSLVFSSLFAILVFLIITNCSPSEKNQDAGVSLDIIRILNMSDSFIDSALIEKIVNRDTVNLGYTDMEGVLRLTGIENRDTLVISKEDYDPFILILEKVDTLKKIDVYLHEESSGKDSITALPVLIGKTLDSDGDPLGGLRVVQEGVLGDPRETTSSHDNGAYSLELAPNSSPEIEGVHIAYSPDYYHVILIMLSQLDTTEINVYLDDATVDTLLKAK